VLQFCLATKICLALRREPRVASAGLKAFPRLEAEMFRATGILVFVVALVVYAPAFAQLVPKALLSSPTGLQLDKPTVEVKVGSTVAYTVTLRNAQDRSVPASSDLTFEVETPSGTRTLILPKGQSSAAFSWQANKPGIAHMTVRSGKLHPATGLVLVSPGTTAQPVLAPPSARALPRPEAARRPAGGTLAGSPAASRPPQRPANRVPAAAAEEEPRDRVASSAAPPLSSAKKIQLYVQPLPVYGNAVDRVWKASVSVAAEGPNDELIAVAEDVPIHFTTSFGDLSASDITLSRGQFSNFEKPVVLTVNRAGQGSVAAISSLGSAGPVNVDYLEPPPAQLRLSLGTPQLSGSGSSSSTVQVCLLDEAGGLTASTQNVAVTLSGPGQFSKPVFTIPPQSLCGEQILWTSGGSGSATIRAESDGIAKDEQTISFPAFPWYFVWLAAVGGVIGALIVSSGSLFASSWWSSTWRSLVLGAGLGAIFYLFARFGAIALPKDSPVNLQNIPVVSGVGSFLLGFLGGIYGRKLWKVDSDAAKA
jgi:hypothetical protein